MPQKDKDLLDFELYYSQYLAHQEQSEEATRISLLKAWQDGRISPKSNLKDRLDWWLEEQNKRQEHKTSSGESLGSELDNMLYWLRFALASLAALLGLLSMSSYLSPGDSINITAYILQYMLFPFLLSLIAFALFIVPSPSGLLPRPLRYLAAGLMKRASRTLSQHLPIEQKERYACAIGQVLSTCRQYNKLLKWKLGRVLQAVFLCYFIGMLGSATYVLSSESKSFTWQTTLTQSITAERLHNVVQMSSLEQSDISIEDIQQTRLSTHLSPQLQHQWGMYCILLICIWGIAPRLLFWCFTWCKTARLRRNYDFKDAYYAPLTRSLMAAPITDSDGSVQELVNAPIRQSIRKACLLLSPDCSPQRLPHACDGLVAELERRYTVPIQKEIQVQSQLKDAEQAWQQELKNYIKGETAASQLLFVVDDIQKSNISSTLKRWKKYLQEWGYTRECVFVGLIRPDLDASQAADLTSLWLSSVKKLASRNLSASSYQAVQKRAPSTGLHRENAAPTEHPNNNTLLIFTTDCAPQHMPELRENLRALLLADGLTPLAGSIQQESMLQDPAQKWCQALAAQLPLLTDKDCISIICPIWLSNTKGCIQKFSKKLRQEMGFEGEIIFTAIGTRPAGLPSEDASLDLIQHKKHISNWQHSITLLGLDKTQSTFYL